VRLLAFEEAMRFFEIALPLVAEDVERCELLLRLGDAQSRAGDDVAAKETFLSAADIARHASMSEHLARAAIGLPEGTFGARGENSCRNSFRSWRKPRQR
jgi:hypothetical protein